MLKERALSIIEQAIEECDTLHNGGFTCNLISPIDPPTGDLFRALLRKQYVHHLAPDLDDRARAEKEGIFIEAGVWTEEYRIDGSDDYIPYGPDMHARKKNRRLTFLSMFYSLIEADEIDLSYRAPGSKQTGLREQRSR